MRGARRRDAARPPAADALLALYWLVPFDAHRAGRADSTAPMPPAVAAAFALYLALLMPPAELATQFI